MWRALVVDDSIETRRLLSEILSEVASCDMVESGERALEAYNNSIRADEPYDFILLDIVMSGLSGIDVLRSIRKKEEVEGIRGGSTTTVVVVTQYKDRYLDAQHAGCDDYMLKPIDSRKLIEKVRSHLDVI